MIEFHCPQCGKSLRAREVYVGRRGRCKYCTFEMIVPAAQTQANTVRDSISQGSFPSQADTEATTASVPNSERPNASNPKIPAPAPSSRMEVTCPACGKSFRVHTAYAGRRGRCKHCDAEMTVPAIMHKIDATAGSTTNTVLPRRDQTESSEASKLGNGQSVHPNVLAPTSRSSGTGATNQPPSTSSDGCPATIKIRANDAATGTVPSQRRTSGEPSRPSVTLPVSKNSGPASPARLSPRTRRLMADSDLVTRTLRSSSLIELREAIGTPPDLYRILYRVRGLARGAGGNPISRAEHLVEIRLTRDYPRQSPQCKMLTPVFHPNIEPATICVGDHWTAGERLLDLIVRIGEMLAYQTYNIKSPLDGEAAMWADLNRSTLPTDSRDLRPPELA